MKIHDLHDRYTDGSDQATNLRDRHRLAAAHSSDESAGVNARWFARSLEGGCKVTSRLAGAKEAGAL